MKKIILTLAIVLGLTQISKAQTPCQGGMSVNVGSVPNYLNIHHSGFYFAFPSAQNVIEWEVTDSFDNIIVQDTIVANQLFAFNHNIPTTDTMNVRALLTNDTAGIACLFEGELYWKETQYPSFSTWSWAFVNEPFGISVLAIDNIEKLTASVYPNPTNGIVNISLEEGSLLKIELYSMTGKLLFKKDLNSEAYALDMGDYSSGLYHMKVFNQNNDIVNTKILKE
ncbi:T9SS type A sorting domain-containing protein [uncultured Flavobacterium sp.]|uniref:T9SS type A sorting domain-containing protein n=1 Tax=uncultured Flavobacterium sp. TaxID=165435 RepID=UPI0030CA38AF